MSSSDSEGTTPAPPGEISSTKRLNNDGISTPAEANAISEKVEDGAEQPPIYAIIRERDDLTIAVWEDTENAELIKSRTTLRETVEHAAICGKHRDNRYLTLVHGKGEAFLVPWPLCLKWTWAKEIIKLTYGTDDAAKKEFDEGKFKITKFGTTILPEHWNSVVQPFNIINITLDSRKEEGILPKRRTIGSQTDKIAPVEPEATETIFKNIVQYRVDLYQTELYGTRESFVQTRTFNKPVELNNSNSRDKSIPVLEEVQKVVLNSVSRAASQGASGLRLNLKDLELDDLLLDVGDKVRPKTLHIRSPLLLNALRSIVKYSSNAPSGDESESFTDGLFPFPFKDLYHHMQELLDFKNETTGPRANHTPEYNAECDEHIDTLLDYLNNEPTVQLSSVKERWEQKVPITTFAGFWLLMKPGTDVYVQENGQLNAYVVDQVSGGILHDHRYFIARSYGVRVWKLVYNGKSITRVAKTIEVPVFDGERDITSLELFPTSFHDKLDNGALRKKLIERGHNFFRFSKGPTFLEYTGTGLKPGWKKYKRARVVIEHQSRPWTLREFDSMPAWRMSDTFPVGSAPPPPRPPPVPGSMNTYTGLGERARAPRCECLKCKNVSSTEGVSISTTFSSYDNIDPNVSEGLSEHQALLCLSHMFGFVLKERSYDILDLNGLSEPTLAGSAIDELVLRPERNKDTIKAIARTYTEVDSQEDLFSVDFIRGKGEGQIFLLHGPPGTGKTLTAESVAEYTKRPLLSITAADLGHEPMELERNLLRFFKSATAWDAIVLLDEADVYLERRSTNDLRRNSIVSIFLRALDYFEGILFFTTNRVGQFDEAFLSRIHVSIGYDPLDDKAREQIWDTLFRKLKSNHKNGGPRIDYEYEAKLYVRQSEDVKRLRWNGREIRNSFQTAVALAIADSKSAKEKGLPESECIPQVTEAHLSQVVSMSAAFKRYIKEMHEGVDESDIAFRLGNRYDRFEPESR